IHSDRNIWVNTEMGIDSKHIEEKLTKVVTNNWARNPNKSILRMPEINLRYILLLLLLISLEAPNSKILQEIAIVRSSSCPSIEPRTTLLPSQHQSLVLADLTEYPSVFYNDQYRSLIPFMSWSIQKENPLLRLTVENCELSSIGVIILLDCLTNAKQLLDVLSIADNHLGSPVAAALARFLGSHVRALNATDIGLGTVGFQILEETLPTEVALSHINI
ncbi:hypothetical protein ACJX0J_041054, partial [Zea mays]